MTSGLQKLISCHGKYKYLSLCLEHRPRYWRDLDAIEKDLQLESHRDHAVKSLVSMIAAHT